MIDGTRLRPDWTPGDEMPIMEISGLSDGVEHYCHDLLREQRMRMPRIAKRIANLSKYSSIALPIMCTAVIFFLVLVQDVEAETPAGIVWFSMGGLDRENNKIDSLIFDFGHLCNRKFFKVGQCRIERELRGFLSRLPPDRNLIERELEFLGAICAEQEISEVSCIYEKQVNVRAMKGVTLISEYDDHYRIELRATKLNESPQYTADVQVTTEAIYTR